MRHFSDFGNGVILIFYRALALRFLAASGRFFFARPDESLSIG
jgi:hypothetical protein